jgi:hypothetical protein
MQGVQDGSQQQAFEVVKKATSLWLREPSGAGLDIPTWLVALEDEVQQVREVSGRSLDNAVLELAVAPKRLTMAEILQQVEFWK